MSLKPKIYPFKNGDKMNHESWKQKGIENIGNFPAPFSAMLISHPNSGKTTLAKNLILHQTPEFERVLVVHHAPESTREYDDINVELTDEIPTKDDFDPNVKNLCILDDVYVKKLKPELEKRLERLFNYCRTHMNVSIIITTQDYSSIPPVIRRACNIFFVWKLRDKYSVKLLSKKIGVEEEDFKNLFKTILINPHDSLCIDYTPHTPYKLRKNIFEPIEMDTEELEAGGENS